MRVQWTAIPEEAFIQTSLAPRTRNSRQEIIRNSGRHMWVEACVQYVVDKALLKKNIEWLQVLAKRAKMISFRIDTKAISPAFDNAYGHTCPDPYPGAFCPWNASVCLMSCMQSPVAIRDGVPYTIGGQMPGAPPNLSLAPTAVLSHHVWSSFQIPWHVIDNVRWCSHRNG